MKKDLLIKCVMKKWIQILSIMLICCFWSVSLTRAEEGFDFRKARWGMTIEETQKTETAQLVKKDSENGELTYTGKLLDKECTIVYKYKKEKLVECFYIFFNIEDGYFKYIFDTIDSQLSKKYTKEESNFIKYLIEIYNNDRTHITLASIKPKNGSNNIIVTYQEKNFSQEKSDEMNKKMMDNKKSRDKELEMF